MEVKKTVVVKQFQVVMNIDVGSLMLYVLDDRGRLWVRKASGTDWGSVDLPEETL